MDLDNDEETLRDTVANAVSARNAEEPAEEPAELPESDSESIAEAVGEELESKVGRDESGKFTKAAKSKAPVVEVKPTVKAPVAPKAKVKGGAQLELDPEAVAPPPITQFKAPQSWKPGVREKFGTLPPEVQAEAVRVDREVQQVHRENATLKQQVGGMNQAMQPYQAMIQSSGARPEQIVGSLLGFAHTLQYGSPVQQARVAAQIIKNNRIDINMLAAELDGPAGSSPAAGSAQAFDPNQLAAQVRQQVLQDIQRQGETRLGSKAQSEVESWSQDKEYFEDLRELMAIELEADAQRKGRLPDGHPAKTPMDFDEAYQRAALSHPDIAPIFQQRQEAARVAAANKAALSRRAASSSIRGQPVGDVDSLPEPGENIRSDIMRAVNALNRRT